MKRNVIILLAAALTGFASLANAQGKIGVVNTDKLLQESPQYRDAQATIDAEFRPRQAEINGLQQVQAAREEKLRKDGATMTELQARAAEKELQNGATELARKSSAAQEDFDARKEEVMSTLQRILKDEISAFSKANGYDLILVSGVGYASAAYDVTNPLLEAMKKKAGVAAPAAAKPPATPAKPPAAPAK
ncbi:MAG: OmpH family outer membrane protein [Pseudomonadota bacterium]